MPDLFPVTIDEMVREVERDITLRRRVYPGWVASKRMSQDKADRQISIMEAVARELQKRRGHFPLDPSKVEHDGT